MVILKFARELHEYFLGRDLVAQFLHDLLDVVVEFGLGSDDVEPIDQLLHDLARVVIVLGGEHAHEQHDSLHQSRIVKVQVNYEPLEYVLMLRDEVI